MSQAIWSLVLWITLAYFYRLYKKKYLIYWSWSWAAYAIYATFAALAVGLSQSMESDTVYRTLASTLSLAGAYQQIFWLLVGTYVLSYKVTLSRKITFWTPLAILLFSLLMALTYNFDSEAVVQRTIIRLGVKSMVFSLIFILSALILLKNKLKAFYIGRRIVIAAFLLFGISQLVYFLFVIDFFADTELWFGIAQALIVLDSMSLALIGLGTMIWLLEEERFELEKTNKNLDSFLYSTSHDLRAPVASLLGLINVARHDVTDKVARNYLKMMGDRVSKLDEIFKDILAYSRSSKGEIKREAIDFNQVLDDLIGDIKFHNGAEEIRLVYEPDPEYKIHTDPTQFKIIMGNLLSNAVKYHDSSKKDKYIKVLFQFWDNDILITVEDNGLGIPKESQHKIFNMFYRAHNYSSGSGLGLFILKEAAEKLNAEITLESEEGKGTVISLQFKNAKVDG